MNNTNHIKEPKRHETPRRYRITKTAGKEKIIRAASFCGIVILLLIFFCVYFDGTKHSSRMVNTELSKIILLVTGLVLIAALAIYATFGWKIRMVSISVFVSSLVFISFLLLDKATEHTAVFFIAYFYTLLILCAVYMKIKKKLTFERGMLLLILAACVFRVGAALAFKHTFAQHDSYYAVDINNSTGHAAYVAYIYQNLSLPQDIEADWQFYHPPLFHIISALFLRLNDFLGVTYHKAVENLQLLTSLYSCLFVYVWYKILGVLRASKTVVFITVTTIAFHPTFLYMGLCLNNDMLMWLLVSCSLLYAVKWYSKPCIKYIIPMGLFLALGMLTKLNAVMLAPAIGLMFLFKLASRKKEEQRGLWKQYFVFAGASIPLGLSFTVRNLVKFGKGAADIPLLSVKAKQYVGNISAFERLIPLDWSSLSSPFLIWDAVDYNIFFNIAKTSLYGEKSILTQIDTKSLLPYIMLALNIILISLSLVAAVWYIVRQIKTHKNYMAWVLFVFYVTFLVSYIAFCFTHPHQCTMDARYIAICIPLGAFFIGKFAEKNSFVKSVAYISVPAFSVVSALSFYLEALTKYRLT